jgi:hypothetical protein
VFADSTQAGVSLRADEPVLARLLGRRDTDGPGPSGVASGLAQIASRPRRSAS